VTWRCGVEKLSGEHASITESKAQFFIQLVFGNQIEFIADMAAPARGWAATEIAPLLA